MQALAGNATLSSLSIDSLNDMRHDNLMVC